MTTDPTELLEQLYKDLELDLKLCTTRDQHMRVLMRLQQVQQLQTALSKAK